jgi:hypothetical protein
VPLPLANHLQRRRPRLTIDLSVRPLTPIPINGVDPNTAGGGDRHREGDASGDLQPTANHDRVDQGTRFAVKNFAPFASQITGHRLTTATRRHGKYGDEVWRITDHLPRAATLESTLDPTMMEPD